MNEKILVIDDEELLTKTFTRLLEKKGYEVLAASRSEDALAIAQEEDFDLVLCDIRMPGRNGVETIREMKSILAQNGRNQPQLIFLTGFADSKLEKEAQTLKPFAYVFKPFDMEKLLKEIESALSTVRKNS